MASRIGGFCIWCAKPICPDCVESSSKGRGLYIKCEDCRKRCKKIEKERFRQIWWQRHGHRPPYRSEQKKRYGPYYDCVPECCGKMAKYRS